MLIFAMGRIQHENRVGDQLGQRLSLHNIKAKSHYAILFRQRVLLLAKSPRCCNWTAMCNKANEINPKIAIISSRMAHPCSRQSPRPGERGGSQLLEFVWTVLCRLWPQSVLVKSDANAWSGLVWSGLVQCLGVSKPAQLLCQSREAKNVARIGKSKWCRSTPEFPLDTDQVPAAC